MHSILKVRPRILDHIVQLIGQQRGFFSTTKVFDGFRVHFILYFRNPTDTIMVHGPLNIFRYSRWPNGNARKIKIVFLFIAVKLYKKNAVLKPT